MAAGYFELGNLFGESHKPAVAAAEAGAKGIGKIANEKTKLKNRKALLDTLFNLGVLGKNIYESDKKARGIAKYAEEEGYLSSFTKADRISPSEGGDEDIENIINKKTAEDDFSFWDNFFSDPTFTKDGKEYTEADIGLRKTLDINVKELFGVE